MCLAIKNMFFPPKSNSVKSRCAWRGYSEYMKGNALAVSSQLEPPVQRNPITHTVNSTDKKKSEGERV